MATDSPIDDVFQKHKDVLYALEEHHKWRIEHDVNGAYQASYLFELTNKKIKESRYTLSSVGIRL